MNGHLCVTVETSIKKQSSGISANDGDISIILEPTTLGLVVLDI